MEPKTIANKKKRAKCNYCNGDGGVMKETPIEYRSYSSTSSGEFNGPYWEKCQWCGGTGERGDE